jgi:nicotinamide-nucleotide amidase
MAEGIRRTAGTSIGISTTGIAGPTGGTTEKPVGLVYIGYADAKESFALKFRFGEGRDRVMERAGAAALELVRRKLAGIVS